ncbi:MAG: nucleotidyl transferase AbiEii/AbiGii toxin family protein [Candidatus Omnitrophica bacterium]|nr:nucleotidyl transferase AbiEii/AbiGii toxin family protein [Candidatus Omnitrophota bacterium]
MKTVEAVPASVKKLLNQLAQAGIFREFYLAGGTGLALRLSHRRSIDLDFFSRTNRLDSDGRRELLARLKSFPGWKSEEAKEGTVHGQIGRVRVSFFWYPNPLVKPFLRRGPLRIASMEDIGLMKIGAIIGRGSRKDFVDLYEICQRIPLSRLFTLGEKKFKDSRDFILQALKALDFFEDAEGEPAVIAVNPLSWDWVKRFFAGEVRTLSPRYLKGLGRR